MFKNKQIINKIEFAITGITFLLMAIATMLGVLTGLPAILSPIGVEVPEFVGVTIAILTGVGGMFAGIRTMLTQLVVDVDGDGMPDAFEKHLEDIEN